MMLPGSPGDAGSWQAGSSANMPTGGLDVRMHSELPMEDMIKNGVILIGGWLGGLSSNNEQRVLKKRNYVKTIHP